MRKRTVHFKGIAKLDVAGVATVRDFNDDIETFNIAVAVQEQLETLDPIDHGGTPTLTISLDVPLKSDGEYIIEDQIATDLGDLGS